MAGIKPAFEVFARSVPGVIHVDEAGPRPVAGIVLAMEAGRRSRPVLATQSHGLLSQSLSAAVGLVGPLVPDLLETLESCQHYPTLLLGFYVLD